MELPQAELTFIVIDNSERATAKPHILHVQVDAVKFYCEKLFKSNPDNAVCLYLITSWRLLVGPTRDLQEILGHLQYIRCGGDARFSSTLSTACGALSLTPTHMKRRLIMFAASRIDLEFGTIHPSYHGRALQKCGVAVTILDFLSKSKTNKYARDLLDSLDTAVNSDGISSIQDVHGEPHLRDILSKSILKGESRLHIKNG